jgi:hypothetical protein
MSRGDGSYDGEFMEDYTDYDISCHNGDSMMSDIDYYSSMEGMGDISDYISKVDKEHYINDSFDYNMVAHNIDYAQASMDDFTAYTVDTMHDEVDNLYTMPHKTTPPKWNGQDLSKVQYTSTQFLLHIQDGATTTCMHWHIKILETIK